MYMYMYRYLRRFPKIGVPSNHPFQIISLGFFHYQPSILGYPPFMETSIFIYKPSCKLT